MQVELEARGISHESSTGSDPLSGAMLCHQRIDLLIDGRHVS
jgi:hypothetical protein